jgi:hypothetical protein
MIRSTLAGLVAAALLLAGTFGGLMMSFLRMLICLAPVLACGVSAARAGPFTPAHKAGSLAYTPICLRASDATEKSSGASTKMRLAFVCRCCGWENWNGHNVCVHQCCN